MVEITLNTNIDKGKINALIQFLRSWDIEVELKSSIPKPGKKKPFSLAAGLWKDYEIDAAYLRKKAWSRNS